MKKLAGHAKKHRKDNGRNAVKNVNIENEGEERNDSSGLFSFEDRFIESEEGEIYEEDNSEEEHFKCLN